MRASSTAYFSLLCLQLLSSSIAFGVNRSRSTTHKTEILSKRYFTGNIRMSIEGLPSDKPLPINKKSIIELPAVPTVKELLRFGLPTLCIWLLQPILSLIDSAIVGKSGSVIELAALGPSIIWCDGTAYLLQFMGMATTNLYATALSEGDKKKSYQVLSQAAVIAAVLGTILGIVQFIFANEVLTMLSGSSAHEIVPLASKYVKIRAIGAPVAMLTMIAQAAFLASKDSFTPLVAVLFGTAINFIGDIILVLGLRMGLVGAAIATMLSQVGGGVYLFFVAINRLKAMAKKELSESHGNPHDATTTDTTTTTTTIATTASTSFTNTSTVDSDKVNDITFPSSSSSQTIWMRAAVKKYFAMPTLKDLIKFVSFAGPIFFVLLSKEVLWIYATVCASVAGTASIAAHQVVINLFVFFCIFGDAVSQTSQTYLPGMLTALSAAAATTTTTSSDTAVSMTGIGKETGTGHSYGDVMSSIRLLLQRILSIGLGAGLCNSLVTLALPTFSPQLFTSSSEVIQAMRGILPFLSLCVLPHCMMSAMEGILIASDETVSLSTGYLLAGACFMSYQTWARLKGLGLRGVWGGLAVFQYLRLFLFGQKVWRKFFITTPTTATNGSAQQKVKMA